MDWSPNYILFQIHRRKNAEKCNDLGWSADDTRQHKSQSTTLENKQTISLHSLREHKTNKNMTIFVFFFGKLNQIFSPDLVGWPREHIGILALAWHSLVYVCVFGLIFNVRAQNNQKKKYDRITINFKNRYIVLAFRGMCKTYPCEIGQDEMKQCVRVWHSVLSFFCLCFLLWLLVDCCHSTAAVWQASYICLFVCLVSLFPKPFMSKSLNPSH